MVLLSLRDCRQFPHVLIAWEEPTRPTAGWRSRTRGNRCGAWRAWVDRFVGPGTWRRAFEVRGGSQRPYAVVCARWCPTLPHPGGCSTIGAVRLSFRVRDGYRAFPCRCDHRDDYMGSAGPSSLVRLFGYPCGRLPTRTHACLRRVRVLVVGLGVDRIVDASLYCGCSPPLSHAH